MPALAPVVTQGTMAITFTRSVTPYVPIQLTLCVVRVPMFPLPRSSGPSQYRSQLSCM